VQSSLPTIWTIGHSTRSLEEFVAMLQSFQIKQVADVRHFPGSRKFPQFNSEALSLSLAQHNIKYQHILDLGGRRKINKTSENIAWRHPAFRAYADYMETADFTKGIETLAQLAAYGNTAYMCSEAVWWRCHRAMISDFLKADGWTVMHIMAVSKAEEHPYTSPAIINDGKLSYR
jgi:uncharacterized protein (DUF488 family)